MPWFAIATIYLTYSSRRKLPQAHNSHSFNLSFAELCSDKAAMIAFHSFYSSVFGLVLSLLMLERRALASSIRCFALRETRVGTRSGLR